MEKIKIGTYVKFKENLSNSSWYTNKPIKIIGYKNNDLYITDYYYMLGLKKDNTIYKAHLIVDKKMNRNLKIDEILND